ncbi:unnamed protein product [Caenorhabditis auriculariae]|uniref:Phosphatidylcholine transfer protein n=1 Tax=Caenorhabditis auriculariae TaxID=2777116 RepID=A0A8S1GT64_9PELO|nr:unnamed protein product [Caenorhabditis auriculariae]
MELHQQWARLKWKRFKLPIRNLLKPDRRFLRRFLLQLPHFSFKSHDFSEDQFLDGNHSKDFDARDEKAQGWEMLVQEKDLKVFRRRTKAQYEIYEYKCVGSYYDISPRTFLDAQNDLEYRKEWDDNIITLELLEEEEDQELVRWVAKYPYPMYPREYIYVRRTWISEDEKTAVVNSDVVLPQEYPSTSSSNVRVCSYTSRMAIRAHKTWNDHGLDYVLTYSDNPEANIPRYVYNWIVNHGGPYFLGQAHKAAREIEAKGKVVRSAVEKALKRRRRQETTAADEQTATVNEATASEAGEAAPEVDTSDATPTSEPQEPRSESQTKESCSECAPSQSPSSEPLCVN